jgi:uncharacterized protein YqgV (UPF0045/DUF77 family)
MKIHAELSLYPLGTKYFKDAVKRFIDSLRHEGVTVAPGEMSTMITGKSDAVFSLVSKAFHEISTDEDVVLVVKYTNACRSQK